MVEAADQRSTENVWQILTMNAPLALTSSSVGMRLNKDRNAIKLLYPCKIYIFNFAVSKFQTELPKQIQPA